MGGIGSAVCRRLARRRRESRGGLSPLQKKDEWLAKMRSEGLQVYAAEGDVDHYESCANFYPDRLGHRSGGHPRQQCRSQRDGAFKRMSPTDWYA